ncbi:MAG TPA: hypothetical protein VL856_07705 [Acidimicrobiia bacterium]|nr:hypothetical protein [Acidimicrobiia bacterium]
MADVFGPTRFEPESGYSVHHGKHDARFGPALLHVRGRTITVPRGTTLFGGCFDFDLVDSAQPCVVQVGLEPRTAKAAWVLGFVSGDEQVDGLPSASGKIRRVESHRLVLDDGTTFPFVRDPLLTGCFGAQRIGDLNGQLVIVGVDRHDGDASRVHCVYLA